MTVQMEWVALGSFSGTGIDLARPRRLGNGACWVWRAAVVAAALCMVGIGLAAEARADGMKFPPKAVRKLPRIPRQQALIRHRDGEQTLIIGTTIDGEGDRFGWIMPVPATPTNLEATEPGLFEVLASALGPEIYSGPSVGLFLLCCLLLLMALVLALHLTEMSDLMKLFVFTCGLGMICMFSVPVTLGGKSQARTPHLQNGVAVEMAQTVGRYDLKALRADSPEDLDRWLDANGFRSLGEAGRRIVQGYINQNWRFVTAIPTRAPGSIGLLAPHPLAITFPAKEAVYPMQLTALNGGPVFLQLYVLSENGVRADGMQTTAAMPMTGEQGRTNIVKESYTLWKGPYGRLTHKALNDLAWTGCILTAMEHTWTPEEMTTDIRIRPGGATEYRMTVASIDTWRGAWALCVFCGVALLSFLLVLAVSDYRARLNARDRAEIAAEQAQRQESQSPGADDDQGDRGDGDGPSNPGGGTDGDHDVDAMFRLRRVFTRIERIMVLTLVGTVATMVLAYLIYLWTLPLVEVTYAPAFWVWNEDPIGYEGRSRAADAKTLEEAKAIWEEVIREEIAAPSDPKAAALEPRPRRFTSRTAP